MGPGRGGAPEYRVLRTSARGLARRSVRRAAGAEAAGKSGSPAPNYIRKRYATAAPTSATGTSTPMMPDPPEEEASDFAAALAVDGS